MESRVSDALVAIRRIVRAAEFASRDLTRATGLTPSQLIVLQIVARAGEPGAGAIAEAARLIQATVTALLDKLEARGFIARQKGQTDRRRITVVLTEAGRRALAETPDLLQDRFSARFSRPVQVAATLRHRTRSMAANLARKFCSCDARIQEWGGGEVRSRKTQSRTGEASG